MSICIKHASLVSAMDTLRGLTVFGTLLLSACANLAPPGETIEFQSADYRFLAEPLRGDPGTERTVNGLLLLPATGTPPYPAVIMLHSSRGRGEQEWGYSKSLLDLGIAIFAIDSFQPRGEHNTSDDQSLVSETSMLADAFAALNRLSADARVDRQRIGILGFSKGGIVALYSALSRFNRAMAEGDNHFAAHVAYYPWCGIEMLDPQTSGMPILIQTGALDSITPVALCEEFVSGLRRADSHADIEVIAYDNARHGFDHPMLKNLSWVPMGAQVPGNCRIREVSEFSFIEETTQENVDADSLYRILRLCGGSNGIAGGNTTAREAALQAMLRKFAVALVK